ncbi:UDP-glucose 4-epimerase [Actinopolymorpha cephalotaxi]|uniref:UDP-glucose 4-epimerase n=1 Tax=Actinopolymorpha cephalotaxi TaxID=504797 RepID=A0A1I2KYE8_9ACTN|nr:UDP-glucose 4-epimerase GalE [Actinopolymorpha cephalotaxi]NYH84644.1 UDP-glucose 4-epimerase [Actinopolymorpha cephalotaxi]SFF69936.1 UDP-glucose 4-epimerase [Actinopolymorpha cephalotaxi]
MKLLVTGGAGYIGGIVATLLLEAGHEVTVLDDLSTGHRDGVPEGAAFHQGAITDAADVLDPSFDGVLHFAAKSLVSESVRRPELYWRTNVCGTLALLDAMRAADVRRIVFSSTAATYGAPETTPITEDVPPQPTNPYGASKLAVDAMLTSEAQAYDLAAVSLRYFNVAGAYAGHGERHDPETHLIPNLLAVAAGERPAAQVFGTDYPTRDGTAVRDYLHVVDLADAHLRALTAATPGRHLICNLGTGTGSTVHEVLTAVREVTGHEVPVEESPRRAGDPPSLVASHDRATAELGWKPRRDLHSMVADAWSYRQRHASS